jgi:hypothetical protein
MDTIYSAEHSEETSADGGVKLVHLTLVEPQARVAVRAPGATLGRAEALVGEGEDGRQNWAAKHFWKEGPPGDQVTVFEFDQPLPAGPIVLRIPFFHH